MSILHFCHYDYTDNTREFTEEEKGTIKVTKVWLAKVKEDYPHLTGNEVLEAARDNISHPIGPNFARVDRIGDRYRYPSGLGGSDDQVAFGTTCNKITVVLADAANPFVWKIKAEYGPVQDVPLNFGFGFGSTQKPISSNPLRWPVTRWIDIIEDEEVAENIVILTSLPQINRGRGSSNGAIGPVVNAAGQQTIDPLMANMHRVVLNVQVFYPDPVYAVALNKQFENTFHAPADASIMVNPSGSQSHDDYSSNQENYPPLLMGSPYYTWKFLGATCEKPQYRKIGEDENEQEATEWDPGDTIEYYTTLIQFEFKLGDWIGKDDLNYGAFSWPGTTKFYSGWMDKILNNGQTCFFKWASLNVTGTPSVQTPQWVMDPRYPNVNNQTTGTKMRFPTHALQLKEDFDLSWEDTREGPVGTRPQPTLDDFEMVPTSEPMNLKLDGTQILAPEEKPTYIYGYRYFPANYYHITDYFGEPIFPEVVHFPTFPLNND